MQPREDDAVPRVDALRSRTSMVAAGFALATLATLAVFLTDNPQYLRVAVVAVAWAFVLATFAAGRRDTDRVAAAAREAELRRAYEAELDREVAARREYELDLEHELRRDSENSMRFELDALRGDIAALSGLRDEVARVSQLRGDLLALTGLRDEVARVAALRDDVAALMSLRQDLGQLAELRADMGRLRAELTEQLSSEMLVERIVMRTQASRTSPEPSRSDGGPGRSIEGGSWADDPPRELTGGWPAIRLDEPRQTTQFEEVRVDRPGLRPPVPDPLTVGRGREAAPPAERLPWDAPLPSWDPPATDDGWRARSGEPVGPPATTMSPIAPSSIARPPEPVAPPGRPAWQRPADPAPAWQRPADPAPTWQRPADPVPANSFPDVRRPSDLRPPVPPPAAATPARPEARPTARPVVPPAPSRDRGVADILAENGASPPSGGRRRRRYRDEDEPDDVLARVLRQS